MKFAARINSFMREYSSVLESIKAISATKEIQYLDMNFQEHFKDHEIKEIKDCIYSNNMKLNGVAIRFRSEYINGAFTNPDAGKRRQAIELCCQGVEHARALGGETLVVWMEHDGFDYAFQCDYEKNWNYTVEAFQKISDYAKDIRVSIEYKPFQPRSYSFIPDIGASLLLAADVGRKNFGLTLDYCHMLMKRENPAQSVSMAASRGKLYGIHINDGYGLNDDGLMIGMASFLQTLEFIYYLKRWNYEGVIYFDTFPSREKAQEETLANVNLYKKISGLIDGMGLAHIKELIEKSDALAVSGLLLNCLK